MLVQLNSCFRVLNWTEFDQSGRSEGVKLDGPKVQKVEHMKLDVPKRLKVDAL